MNEIEEAIAALDERLQITESLEDVMEYRESIIVDVIRSRSLLNAINNFLDTNYPEWDEENNEIIDIMLRMKQPDVT